jgi:hypothetical protein
MYFMIIPLRAAYIAGLETGATQYFSPTLKEMLINLLLLVAEIFYHISITPLISIIETLR